MSELEQQMNLFRRLRKMQDMGYCRHVTRPTMKTIQDPDVQTEIEVELMVAENEMHQKQMRQHATNIVQSFSEIGRALLNDNKDKPIKKYDYEEDETKHPETRRTRAKWYCWQQFGCNVPMQRPLSEHDLKSIKQCQQCVEKETLFRALSCPTTNAKSETSETFDEILARDMKQVDGMYEILDLVRPTVFTSYLTCDQKLCVRNNRLETLAQDKQKETLQNTLVDLVMAGMSLNTNAKIATMTSKKEEC